MTENLDKAFEIAAADFFAGDGNQMELWDDAAKFFSEQAVLDEAGALPPEPRNPRYTAATLKANRPAAYNVAVWMRLQQMPHRYVAKVAGICTNTVAAIDREIERNAKVETVRKLIAADARSLARLTLERLREVLLDRDQSELDEGKLANVMKHAVQMAELLEGNATERVEWNPQQREATTYEDIIQAAEDAEVIDAEIGPGGENERQREGRLDPPNPDGRGQDEEPEP